MFIFIIDEEREFTEAQLDKSGGKEQNWAWSDFFPDEDLQRMLCCWLSSSSSSSECSIMPGSSELDMVISVLELVLVYSD